MAHTQMNHDDVPTAMELAGAISQQHGMIRHEFQAAHHGSATDREIRIHRLLRMLAMHETAEQVTIHQALEHAGGGQVGVGQDRAAEEQQTVQLVERLQELTPGTYEHDMQFELLEEAVIHHAKEEETSEVPLFGTLDATERWRFGEALAAVLGAVDSDEPVEYGRFSTMLRDSRDWLTG